MKRPAISLFAGLFVRYKLYIVITKYALFDKADSSVTVRDGALASCPIRVLESRLFLLFIFNRQRI